MSGPSRNEPCPCGSGKKYKACCLDQDEAIRRGDHPHEADGPPNFRIKVVDEVMEFAERAHKKVLNLARETYPRLDDFEEEDVEGEPPSEDEELDWTERWINAVMFDLPANKDEVVAEAYLRRMSGKLREEERIWLQAMLDAPLMPYEVLELEPGVGFRAGCLANGAEAFLSEPDASEDLAVGDLFAARVSLIDGRYMIEGGSYTYPSDPDDRKAIEAQVAKYVQEGGARTFDELDLRQRRLFSVILHAIWTEWVLTVDATEGDDAPADVEERPQ